MLFCHLGRTFCVWKSIRRDKLLYRTAVPAAGCVSPGDKLYTTNKGSEGAAGSRYLLYLHGEHASEWRLVF